VGPLAPVKVRPGYFVCDNGQRRDDAANQDGESEGRVLAVRVVLNLCATWAKESEDEKWRAIVEKILARMIGRPAVGGVQELTYLADDPLDAVFLDGATAGVWLIDFEVRHFVALNVLGDWA
jgi:hypothetical protein